jgi:Kef-type K+ transport system membrane component KefB
LIGWIGILLLIALGTSESDEIDSPPNTHWKQAVAISVAAFGGTFVLASLAGCSLGIFVPALMGAQATLLSFSMAIGLACAVTALPVLISMLHESNDQNSTLGKLAVRIAVLDDLWLWLMMAVLLGLVNRQTNLGSHLLKVAGLVACALFLFKPVVHFFYQRFPSLRPANSIILGLTLIVLCASASEALGLHALFGAFISGWIVPPPQIKLLKSLVLPVTQALFVPFFFIATGMHIALPVASSDLLLLTAGFTVMGLGIKMILASLAARATGLAWGESIELGALLQCKGLMEIVTLGIMHDAKIISTPVFSALIVMALLCTILTAPMRSLVGKFRNHPLITQQKSRERKPDDANVSVSHPKQSATLFDAPSAHEPSLLP